MRSYAPPTAAPESAAGLWLGCLNFAGNISGVIAPIVTGLLLERTGSHYAGFVVAVVMLLMSFALLLFINALQAWQRRRAGALS